MIDNLIHWNIKGLKTRQNHNFQEKVSIISDLLSKIQSTTVLNLQETHLTEENEIPQTWLNFRHIYHIISTWATPEDRFAGITIFINKTFEIVETIEIIKGRAIFIKVKSKDSYIIFNLFSIYGKASGNSTQKSDFFK